MFRLFTAGGQAHSRLSNALLRTLHNTSSLRSGTKSTHGDWTVDIASAKPQESAESATHEPYDGDRALQEAAEKIVKDAEARASRRKKENALETERRDGVSPQKVRRPQKKAALGAVTSGAADDLPTRKPRKPRGAVSPAVAQQNARCVSKFSSLEEPREAIETYLKGRYGGNWKGSKATGDRRRMNVISADACDAVLARLKPSLEKHMGCDVLDINPGAGVWSEKLHDVLKPRTHILLEPDYLVYGPLLEPLVAAPNSTYKLVKRSGLIWGHLEAVLSEKFLPLQTAWKHDDPRIDERNDTLLVVANLGYDPKIPYKGFSSLAQMVIYQFLGAVKAHSLFQKYGLVRMLIWINNEERYNILPRTIAERKKSAIEASFALEKLEEVASGTESPIKAREQLLDLESGYKVLQRMAASGIDIPEGRESLLMQQLNGGAAAPNRLSPRFHGTSPEEVTTDFGVMEPEGQCMDHEPSVALKSDKKSAVACQERPTALCDAYEDIMEDAKTIQDLPDSEQKDAMNAALQARIEAWDEEVTGRSRNSAIAIRNNCENRIALRRDLPLLLWDRREVEPLKLQPNEFYPSKTMCLLDLQPKPLPPLLRDNYPDTYDILEYLLGSFFTMPSQSVKHGLIGLVPGAYEWIDENCHSLKDYRKGGSPDLDRLTVRMLSEELLLEMVEAWQRWPFRPTKYEMLSRMGSSVYGAAAYLEGEDFA